MRAVVGCLSLFAAVLVPCATAQSRLAAGVSASAVRLTDQRAEQALSAIVEYLPYPWLSLSAIPSLLHISDQASGRSVSSNGPGDVPVVVAASHAFATPGTPSVGAALMVVLPAGNAACGLGSGQTSLGFDVGAGIAPTGGLRLSADVSRSFSGFAQSSLDAPGATTLRVEAGYDVSPRWTASASIGADVSTTDSTQALSRAIGVGVSHALRGPLAFSISGSHGLTGAPPQWVVSVAIGTVFTGTSPVAPTTPLRQLKTALAGGVNRGSGAGKTGCP
jgi:hypothetical protein